MEFDQYHNYKSIVYTDLGVLVEGYALLGRHPPSPVNKEQGSENKAKAKRIRIRIKAKFLDRILNYSSECEKACGDDLFRRRWAA